MANSPSPGSIPRELAALNQWVVWRYEERDGKSRTKVPYAASGGMASTTDPSTWSTLEQALNPKRKCDGIGFVVSADDPFCGIDLDHCVEDGVIQEWAREIIEQFDSYTEITPSGSGVRIWIRGDLGKHTRNRKDNIEIYCKARYFTVTGEHFPGTPITIESRPDELETLYLHVFGLDLEADPAPACDGEHPQVSDLDVIQAASQSANGGRFSRLMAGDLSDFNGDQSRADLSLCNDLMFHSFRNVEQVDRIFRTTTLYRPKWDEVHFSGGETYGQHTIRLAIDQHNEKTPKGYTMGSRERPDEEKRETGKPLPLPEIRVSNRQLRDLTSDCLRALLMRNTPAEIFVRTGALARVRADEKGRPVIELMDESQVRSAMTRVANYLKFPPPKKEEFPAPVNVDPPLSAVRDIMALGHWPDFPALDCIIETPALRPDGTIISKPGYDAKTCIYYYPEPGLKVPEVPEYPSAEQVEVSSRLINEVLYDFPFTDAASRDNALALLLTPIVRPAIDGPVPLALLDAPMSGTGKSLLAEAITLITTGKPAAMMSHPTDDEEMRKKITSILEHGSTMIVIDNVVTAIESAALALALTSRVWQDRLLGRNKTITLEQHATWVATGNNIRLNGDIPRRCYWIRMDAQTSQPEQRENFRHPDLLKWISETRGDLLAALLIVARAWYAAGCPRQNRKRRMGSFESWERTVGGILNYCGRENFLTNWEELHSTADAQNIQKEAFLRAIYTLHGDEFLKCGILAAEINKGGDLQDTLPLELAEYIGMKSFPIRIGNFLGNLVDNRFGIDGLHVKAIKDTDTKTNYYKIVIW